MDKHQFMQEEIASYEDKAGFTLDAHSKKTLRSKLESDYRYAEKSLADVIHGFDDGEPQTTPDFNHYEGTE